MNDFSSFTFLEFCVALLLQIPLFMIMYDETKVSWILSKERKVAGPVKKANISLINDHRGIQHK